MSTDKNTPSVQKILRSSSIMSAGTFLSRILGFVRDMLFARFFGTAAGADAFVTAFRLPNLFRDIIGEGAANSSFIPIVSEYKEKRPKDVAELMNAVFWWALIILSAVTVVCIIFAPQIVKALAPGFAADPGKLELTVALTRLMFPYLIFIGLTAFLSAVQFTYGSFGVPSLGPCLMNVILIVSTVVSVWYLTTPLYGLAAGVLVGGVAQFLFQWFPLRARGVRIQRPQSLKNAGAFQVGKLLLPRIAGTAVYQLNIFVDTICASFSSIVGAGGISAIYYATRLVLFPMGIFAVSLTSASLPTLSSHAAAGRMDEFKKTVVFALENVFFVMVPMAVFFILFAVPIVRVVFERGVFTSASTYATASAFLCFSLGLVFFSGSKILAVSFHALKDTATPVKTALICLVVNAVLNVAFMFPLQLAGIALASACASVVNFNMLLNRLRQKIGGLDLPLGPFFVRAFTAVLLASICAEGVWWATPKLWEWVRLCLAGTVFGIEYFMAARMLKMEQAKDILALVRRTPAKA